MNQTLVRNVSKLLNVCIEFHCCLTAVGVFGVSMRTSCAGSEVGVKRNRFYELELARSLCSSGWCCKNSNIFVLILACENIISCGVTSNHSSTLGEHIYNLEIAILCWERPDFYLSGCWKCFLFVSSCVSGRPLCIECFIICGCMVIILLWKVWCEIVDCRPCC